MIKKAIINFFKGIAIGIGMIVPGFGGGTTAIVLGVYSDLISAVANIFKPTKEKIVFLFTIGIGAVVGILSLSKAIPWMIDAFRVPMMFLFIGAMFGSLPILISQARIPKFSPGVIIWPIVGAAIVFLLSKIPENSLSAKGDGIFGILIIILAGLLVAIALILPGISASYMLLILGLYESTLAAINNRDILYISLLGAGIIGGSFIFAKILESSIAKYSAPTFLIIIGFLLGSIKDIFPGVPTGMDIVYSFLTLTAGFLIVFFVTRKSVSEDNTVSEPNNRAKTGITLN